MRIKLIVLLYLGANSLLQAQWQQSGATLSTSNQVVVSNRVKSNEIEFNDANLGHNYDNTRIYRDDQNRDQTYLKLMLGDEQNGIFEIGYKRYQDGVWVPNFSFNRGNLGIATSIPDEKLTVNGNIHAKEVRVDLSVPGPDYVFESDYKLRELVELGQYIRKNKHLPEIPSAKEMEKEGVEIGKLNMVLLKKVEELTLHLIKLNKKIDQLEVANKALVSELRELQTNK